MDQLLNDAIPAVAWQWANLLACTIGGFIGAWMCLASLHVSHAVPRGALASLRWAVALCSVAFALTGLATVEVLFGGAAEHKPTEVALNIALALLFMAVWRFHSSFITKR